MTYLPILKLGTFLILLAVGLLLFVSFRMYRKFRLPSAIMRRDRYKHEQKLQRIEFIVWACFIFVVIAAALRGNLIVSSIIIVLVILAFFKFWKNYFAGIVIKFTEKFQLGDSITMNESKGNIIELSNTNLVLATAEGTEVLIPYSKLDTQIKIEQKSSPKILSKSMSIPNVYMKTSGQKQELENLLNMNPWLILSKPIKISTDEKGTNLSFYVLNNEIYNKAVYWMQDRLEGLKEL